jgi:hypothetical protein
MLITAIDIPLKTSGYLDYSARTLLMLQSHERATFIKYIYSYFNQIKASELILNEFNTYISLKNTRICYKK